MKIALFILSVMALTNSAYASNKCFKQATQLAESFVVAGTSLKQVKFEPNKDASIEKYVVTIQSNSQAHFMGHVIIILSSVDCSEVMSIPSF